MTEGRAPGATCPNLVIARPTSIICLWRHFGGDDDFGGEAMMEYGVEDGGKVKEKMEVLLQVVHTHSHPLISP